MAERIFTELAPEPSLIAEAIRGTLASRIPGAEAPPDTLEGGIVDGVAEEYATAVEILSDVLDNVLAEAGRQSGLVQTPAQPATGSVSVTSDGKEPYVLPAGSAVTLTAADESQVRFVTSLDTPFPVGDPVGTPVTVTGVAIRAEIEGTDGNGLTGQAQPDQSLVWLSSMDLEGATGGGTDGEDDEAFLNKTASEMQLNSSQVIVPEDAARRVLSNPAVGGVTVLDLTDPSQPGVQVANAVTILPRDLAGEPLTTMVKLEVAADLASRRETNFGLFLADYTYTTVNIAVTVAAYPALLAYCEAEVEAALALWLSPLSWSQPQQELTAEWWTPARHVRVGEVIATARAVSSVAYVEAASVRINGLAADLTLPGLGPLTRPGTIAVTVVERVP